MNARSNGPSQRAWDTTRQSREQRLAAAARYAIVQSGVVLAEHLDLFEAGIAKRLDLPCSR
ncbi:hypothetical protein OHD62_01665 [Mesorhizobium sp. YC-39]|uniref:hypothetical protein n=1 Tax=unclassified Mesorhizobium TaxID=325217 RepID=UPI0021E84311|nr:MULTISPECIES: hypothetical protein [unclassified Mesorhizobium]MCV3206535.1 hypothetical protein [Mesorhizobium sp. YC-2]MCV3227065.1 hypothetical protein [Mesorhizobium sp. YC-39]